MKIIQYGLILAGLLGIAGCETTSSMSSEMAKENKMMTMMECVFPHTSEPAPNWVCDEPVPGIAVTAVGVAEQTKGGVAFQKDMAAADALGQLAEQFKVQASKMIKKYLGATGVGSDETIDAAAESVIKTVSSATVSGARRYKSRTGPEGRLYILLGLDHANTEKAVEAAVLTSIKNKKAAWQKFLAEKAFDELAREIAKQSIQ